MSTLGTWDQITGAIGSTTSAFGGEWGNYISKLLTGEDIGLIDPTKKPNINTEFRFRNEKLRLNDTDDSHQLTFTVDDINTGPMRKVHIRRMNNPNEEDYMVLESQTQTLSSKTLNSPTLVTPIMSTISNSGTITIPTGTRTLVARDTNDTLTNKTINIANNTIIDPSKSQYEFLYIIYIDTNDSNKYKAFNLNTNEVTDSGSSIDCLSLFNTVIAAASTARKPILIGKGLYKFSAAPEVAGKWIHLIGNKNGHNGGGKGDPSSETVLKKAYTDNTNPFINWDGSSTWTQQHWKDIYIEGKDSTDNGNGTFDDGGIGFQIKSTGTAISEIYDVFENCSIAHFGTGLKLMKCYQLTFHELCVYKCSSKGIHLTNDGTTGQCFEIRLDGGEVRFCPINIHVEKATHTRLEGTLLEGDSASPYTLVNSVKIDSTGYDTRIFHCSFENNVNSITDISDSGLGTTVDACRFGGLIWTSKTIYNATATGAKGNIINNTISPYANSATATILLTSGSKHMTIIGNHVMELATSPALTITDNSGNSTTNCILANTSGSSVIDNKIGNATTFLNNTTIMDSSAGFGNNLLNLYKANTTDYLDWGIAFDGQDNNGTRRQFGRIYTTSDDNDVAAEDTFFGFDYIVNGVIQQRALFYNNGLTVGIPGERVRLESLGLTANRIYTTENFDGRLLNHNSPVAQSPIVRRWGVYQPAAGTTAATVGALSGMLMQHTPTGGGSNTTTFDGTEGQIVNLVSAASANVNAGLVSTAAGGVMVRRAFKTKATIRCKIDSTTASRFYFGFTSNAVLPITDTPLGNTEHGVIVGFTSADSNYTIRTNDGATSVTSTALSTPTAKNTSFHTITIEWTASGNVVVTFDNIITTVSTDLPGTTTNLYFNAVAQTTASAAAKTLSLKGVWIDTEG